MISNEMIASFDGSDGFIDIKSTKNGKMKESQFKIQGKKIIPILTRYKTAKGRLHTRLLRDFSKKRKAKGKKSRRSYKK